MLGFVKDLFSSGGTGDFQDAIDIYEQLDLPDYYFQDIDPVMLEDSLLASYSADPRLRQAQLDALDSLQEIVDMEGLTATDRARLEDINRQESAIERGNREAIMQNAAARGVGGSGLELAQQLISGQESAGRRAQQGFDVAADAEQRALDAMMMTGQLSGDMRGQEFAEAQAKAQAQDMINQFNVQNQNMFSQYNQEQRNALKNQAYQDALARAHGMSGAYQGAGSLKEGRRSAGNQVLGGIAGMGAMAAMGLSDKDEKKNIELSETDIENFLKSLTNYKYEYKDPENGEGTHFSVMAQDMEKTPVGKSMVVYDEFGRKNIDYGKGMGVMLSALKSLSEKVEEMS